MRKMNRRFIRKKVTTRNLRIRGFTLVELMVTISITAILLALASPALRSITQNNPISTQLNELQVALSVTRSEAIKRNTSGLNSNFTHYDLACT